ncbi:hypothetical protein [Magnetospirillum moscoviense]|uniref:hypothetical protein n=1 Tax=Magnetospirillum moscoviense TaxID=1437059 RepID=UPI000B22BAB4|nr:hypothetical protein [Magnetospirillum moscoviense]MBF0324534.1 hypothetical protein [Alphaproteobacteria bacterium]
MSTNQTSNDKNKPDPMKDKKADEIKKPHELTPEELKKVSGGKLGAPIYKKKP